MLLECIINNRVFPSNSIGEILIKESIHSQIIEGEITIFDFAFIDPKEIYESSEYQISFVVYDIIEDVKKMITFLIYSIDDGSVQGDNRITLKFSSWYAPNIYSKTFTSHYENLEHTNIIKRLLNKNLIEVNEIVNSIEKVDLTLPNVAIKDNIEFLLKYCVDENKRGGFLSFPDLFTQKMNIVNYNFLNKGGIQKYENTIINDDKNIEYVGNITNLDIIQEYDLLKMLDDGVNTKLTTFNFNNGKVETIDNDIQQLLLNEDASYSKIMLNKKFNNKDFGKVKSILGSNKNEMKRLLSNIHYKVLNNSFKINVNVMGDYNRKLGGILPLAIYKYDKDGIVVDNKISGAYLLQEIEHRISTKNYTHSLIISKSGVTI
jgi:hypothetical protein